MKPVPAIVVGLCAHGLHIVRNLSRHGVPVIAVESNLSQPTARTRYGEKVYCENLKSEALIDCLLDIYQQYQMSLPVFLTNDKMLEMIDAHWPRVEGKFLFPFTRSLLQPLMVKDSLHPIAAEHGFRLPRSFTLKTVDDVDSLPADLFFPVILKPSVPLGSFKTRICDALDDVVKQLTLCPDEPLILQEWIPGKEDSIYFCAYYIANDLTCSAWYSGRNVLSYPDVTGNSGATEPMYYPQLLEDGLAFFKKIGFSGLCSIEYKGLDVNAPYFIEVTVGRTDWWVMCSTINGANLHMAAYNDLTKANIPYHNHPASQYLWHISDRALPMIVEKLKTREWQVSDLMRYLVRPKKFAVLDFGDPVPFVFASLATLKRRVKSLMRRFRI
mgnify:CR=1 FL=1